MGSISESRCTAGGGLSASDIAGQPRAAGPAGWTGRALTECIWTPTIRDLIARGAVRRRTAPRAIKSRIVGVQMHSVNARPVQPAGPAARGWPAMSLALSPPPAVHLLSEI